MKSLFFLVTILVFSACSAEQNVPDSEALSRIHCASCHAYPSPDLLDKKSWDQHILPRMGFFMGVLPMDSAGANFIEPTAMKTAYENPNIFRKEKTVSEKEWKTIRDFYLKNAPEKLPENKPLKIEKELPFFRVEYPPHFISPPSSTLVKISEKNKIYLGDFHSNKLYLFDEKMELKSKANIPSGVVAISEINEGEIVTSIGSFAPTDEPKGALYFLPKNKKSNAIKLVDGLCRPVHTGVADLDGDGRFDLIISEFGKWTGGLSWWKNDGKGDFEKHVLRNMPGAVRTEIKDMNNNGLPDIVALFAQGDEGILIFWNKGNGKFVEENLLRFPPSFGSSYFSFFDFNGDGFLDIIYTCGDNADFTPINKPYHGIYIFENNKKNKFQRSFFYPLNGAYKAIPADFDGDGFLDIAAISFFPDFAERPEGGFVFLRGKRQTPSSPDDFTAHTFPGFSKGRWITMDAGDLDGDGDLDLVLGSLAFEVIPDKGEVERWKKEGVPFVVLQNLRE